MNQHKKSLDTSDLARLVKNRMSHDHRKTAIELFGKEANYFIPNSVCAKRGSFKKLNTPNLKPMFLQTRKSNAINSKKNSIEPQTDFCSSINNVVSRKSTHKFVRSCFNSTLSNIHREFKIDQTLKPIFKQKNSREFVSKSKNKSFQNLSMSGDQKRIGVLETQQNITSDHSPINIFNIKNYTVMGNTTELLQSKARNGLSFDENLVILNQKRPVSNQLKLFLNNSKSLNHNNSLKTINKSSNHVKKDTLDRQTESSLCHKSFGDMENLIGRISRLKTCRIEQSTQKTFPEFYQVNLSSTNINSLIKDIAKSKLLKKFMEDKSTQNTVANSTKNQIIKECISMTQEQLFFEELLQILGEKGVDIENLFAYCYERLKIDISWNCESNAEKDSNFKILSDSFSCLNSEISVLDHPSIVLRNNHKMSLKKRKLKLDMRNVKQEIFSSNDDN